MEIETERNETTSRNIDKEMLHFDLLVEKTIQFGERVEEFVQDVLTYGAMCEVWCQQTENGIK